MMDIRSQLLLFHNKENATAIAQYVGTDVQRFKTLLDLMLFDEYRVVQRAAWSVGMVVEKMPSMMDNHWEALILHLGDKKIPDAVKRNACKILSTGTIPTHLHGHALQIGFDFLVDHSCPVAIRMYGLQVVFNVGKSEPDLMSELLLILDELIPEGQAAIKSRGIRIRKAILKMYPYLAQA